MSALQQLLDRRRGEASDAHICHAFEAQVAALTVVTSAHERWIFPWHQLATAQFSTSAGRDRLALSFTTHVVTLTGRDLEPLCDLVAHLQLSLLRPAPAKYAKASNAEPFVEGLQVAPHSPPTGSG